MYLSQWPSHHTVYAGRHRGHRVRPDFILCVLLVVLALALATGAARVHGNLAARSHPPVACQTIGGQWNWWGGWACE